MKAVAAAVAEMPQEAIAELEKNGSYTLQLDGTDAVVETAADVEIFSEDIPGWLVANEGKLTVALEVYHHRRTSPRGYCPRAGEPYPEYPQVERL